MIDNLLGLPNKLISGFTDTAAIICIALFLFVAPSCTAYLVGKGHAQSKCTLDEAAEQTERLRAALTTADYNAQIAGDYVLRRAATTYVYRTIREEVPRVVTHYVRVPGTPPQPVPACVFTTGFVRLWNEALQGGAGAAARTAADAAATVPQAGAAEAAPERDLYDAGLSPGDVLQNLIANAEVASQVRSQCDAIRAIAIGPKR